MLSNANNRYTCVSAAGIVQRHHMNKINFSRYIKTLANKSRQMELIDTLFKTSIQYLNEIFKDRFNTVCGLQLPGPELCIDGASTAHRKHKASDIKHVDVCPLLLQDLPQMNFVGRGVWASLRSSFN